MAATLTQANVWEDSGATCMARIVGSDAGNIQQADISSIACTVTRTDTSAAVATPAIVVANTVFDTLQTDSRWTKDTTGYNFRHTILAASLAESDITYRVEYAFTPSSGQVFHVVFELRSRKIYRS